MSDPELQRFQSELLAAVREAKSGVATRRTQVSLTAAAQARARVGLSQSQFAALLGVSVRTLQDWEQGRREPSGAARTLLRIAVQAPEVVRNAASRAGAGSGALFAVPRAHPSPPNRSRV